MFLCVWVRIRWFSVLGGFWWMWLGFRVALDIWWFSGFAVLFDFVWDWYNIGL